MNFHKQTNSYKIEFRINYLVKEAMTNKSKKSMISLNILINF